MKTTRRTFLKRAGTSAGLLIASGWSPFSYAANSKSRLGLIGVGSQNCFHIEQGIAWCADSLEVAAMADCLKPSLAAGVKAQFPANPATAQSPQQKDAMSGFWKDHCYLDYRDMLDRERDAIDAVVIATPTSLHQQMVLDCLDAGKHVFCEKNMGHTYDGCREIVRKVHATGKVLQVGHQRRYNPEYIHAAAGYRNEGRVGRVTSIDGHWYRYGDWKRPLPMSRNAQGQPQPYTQAGIDDLNKLVNWRVYSEYSMGLIGELCAHHVDCVNWLLGTPPARVWATGSIDYWKDDRTTFDNATVVFEYDLKRAMPGFVVASPNSAGTLIEARSLLKPYKCRFAWSGSLQADNSGELLTVQGDRVVYALRELHLDGTGQGCSLDEGIRYRVTDNQTGKSYLRMRRPNPTQTGIPRYGPNYTEVDPDPVPFRNELDQSLYNKSAEVRQFEAFAKCIQEGKKPLANEMCGLMASIAVIAAHESATQGKTIEIDPALYTFDFETPNAFEVGTVA